MLDKDLMAFLALNPPIHLVSDFRVLTVKTPARVEELIDCVLATSTGPNQQPTGIRVRMTEEAAVALVAELQQAIGRAQLSRPPQPGEHGH